MEIKNIDGLRVSEIKAIIEDGGRFVFFPYTVSIGIATFKRASSVYLIRNGEKSIKYSYKHVLTNGVIGWWGIPWGPIYTIGSMYHQAKGGKDVTSEILSHLIQHDPEADTSTYNINGVLSSNMASQADSQPTYNIPR